MLKNEIAKSMRSCVNRTSNLKELEFWLNKGADAIETYENAIRVYAEENTKLNKGLTRQYMERLKLIGEINQLKAENEKLKRSMEK